MASVDFLFVYEIKARELDSVCLLMYELRRRGCTVDIRNSWYNLTQDEPMPSASVVVIPACYTSGIYHYFSGHAKSFDKAIDLQWEQIRYRSMQNPGKSSVIRFSGAALSTRHVCWGERSRARMLSMGVADDCARVCGYMPLDFYRPEMAGFFYDKEVLFQRYGLDTNRRTLLFVSSFAHVNLPKEQTVLFSDRELRKLTRLHQESQNDLVGWFLRYLNANPGTQIIYRPHPSEKSNDKLARVANDADGFHVISGESIKQWMRQSDVVLNWNSTSVVEAFASGKKTLLLRPRRIPHSLSYPMFSGSRVVTGYRQFEQELAHVETSDSFPLNTERLLSYYSITETPAYLRVCDLLEDSLKDNDYWTPDLRSDEYIAQQNRPKAQEFEGELDNNALFTLEKAKQNYAPPEEVEETIARIAQALAAAGK